MAGFRAEETEETAQEGPIWALKMGKNRKLAPNPKFHTDDHHICPVNEHSSFGVSFIFLAMTCESF